MDNKNVLYVYHEILDRKKSEIIQILGMCMDLKNYTQTGITKISKTGPIVLIQKDKYYIIYLK